MTRITLNPDLAAKLRDLGDFAELYDERGCRIGVFKPDPPRDANGRIIVPFSDEELRIAQEQTGGRPLSEILGVLSRSAK